MDDSIKLLMTPTLKQYHGTSTIATLNPRSEINVQFDRGKCCTTQMFEKLLLCCVQVVAHQGVCRQITQATVHIPHSHASTDLGLGERFATCSSAQVYAF